MLFFRPWVERTTRVGFRRGAVDNAPPRAPRRRALGLSRSSAPDAASRGGLRRARSRVDILRRGLEVLRRVELALVEAELDEVVLVPRLDVLEHVVLRVLPLERPLELLDLVREAVDRRPEREARLLADRPGLHVDVAAHRVARRLADVLVRHELVGAAVEAVVPRDALLADDTRELVGDVLGVRDAHGLRAVARDDEREPAHGAV